MLKNKIHLVLLVIATVIVTALITQYLIPAFTRPPQTKPEPIVEEKVYEYYVLMDEETGKVLGHVSSLEVNTGDEYISENDKRYIVTKVEENRAYMRSFGPADGEKEKGKFKDKTN